MQKVVVGMSGGVDSSVSVALLQEAGYEVYGAFIRVWEPAIGTLGACDWREERRDALRVAAHLGISLETLDAQELYKKDVVDEMIAEYTKGRTPNPDVLCNRSVKFDVLMNYARSIGAEKIATGHYARTEEGKLFAGVDTEKDQSYFLWGVSQELLSHTLFPIGGMTKKEVREYARRVGLPNAEKKDSQGICFIGPVDVKDFLRAFITAEKGNILNEEGKVIGSHSGALLFTLGERHGFTITDVEARKTPLYVVGKDVEVNTLTVSPTPLSQEADSQEIKLERVNWIGEEPREGKEYSARLRYRAPLTEVKLRWENRSLTSVMIKEPTLATSGQSLVLYDGDRCLGGGIIV